MSTLWKRIWTEINLDNLIYNFKLIKTQVSDGTAVCCVVKANAYGHHAPRIARELENAGADFFAVSNVEEALQLRGEGIKKPILILGYTPADCAKILCENNISQCVYSSEYANELSECAVRAGCKVRAHIKIDTGMGRLGFQWTDGKEFIDAVDGVCRLEGLSAEGIFTHFAKSDGGECGRDFTLLQYERFSDTVSLLEQRGIKFTYRHCANSAAVFDYPAFQMNMVRAGIVLYGLSPSPETVCDTKLKPVMSLKTVISHIKTVDAGTPISYGGDFVSDRKMKIATVPMGYADGFWRSNGKQGVSLLVGGKKAPIVGRICMDQLMLDVSDIAELHIGDEVTVFGDACGINTADALAEANGTINYEIICSVGKRVPRVFIKNGGVDGIHLGMLDTTVN